LRSRQKYLYKIISHEVIKHFFNSFAILQPTHSSVNKAFELIGHKIKLYDVDVEVISFKATKDGIFLEVEENVEGELIRYEINYEDVVSL
jgi:hypothetical protein